jgi:hypothetical protein
MNPIQLFTAAIAVVTFISTLLINPVFGKEEKPIVPGKGREGTSNEYSLQQTSNQPQKQLY